MPKYFDPILQDSPEINVNGETILYLVEVGSDYSIKGITADDLDRVGSDPHTLASRYWPINDIAVFLANVEQKNLQDIIFPSGELTTEPLPLALIQSLGLHPRADTFVTFSEEVREQLKEAAYNDRLTGEGLARLVHDYFRERITPENHYLLWDAWEDLEETGSVTSRAGKAAIAQLNITPAAIADFVYKLTHDTFAFNADNQAYIESLFTLSNRYPSHFERFAIQVGFEEIIVQYDPEQMVDEDNEDVNDDGASDETQNDEQDTEDDVSSEPEDLAPHPEQGASRATIVTANPYRGRLFSDLPTPSLTQHLLERELDEFVTEYFRNHITRDNFRCIATAWSAYLRTNTRGVTGRSHLALLNIPSRHLDVFFRSLSREYSNVNDRHREYIFTTCTLNDEFPGHAYRFGRRLNLTDLLEERGHELFARVRPF